MKLADRVVETHNSGIVSENKFSIQQSSKMFKILSDSLYSDKIQAVIRELSTNAYDSHIASGNQNPFKVILPNAANPNFVVRDYGTGLSQADMENLYTTYGASNKNTSNDFVGCLGLGSKSPFAYTKSFTTSSYFNGQKYTYVAAIDDSGVPTLNLFNISETDGPNGLEISFAVKQYDFAEFSSKSMRIFHYFKMKPIIEGGVLNNLKDHKYSNRSIVLSGDGWRVCRLNNDTNYYPNVHHHIDSGVVALMGNIAYPVKTSQIIGEDKQTTNDAIQRWNRAFQKADIDSWKSFVNEIINQNLYLELDFGIGELEMDVSREGLQYTKNVIKTLREKTQEIYLEMKEEFSKKISAAKTKVEAITLYYTLNDLAGGWGVGAEWTDLNGKKHNINSGTDLEYKISAGKSMYVFNYRSAGYRSRRMVYQTNSVHHNTLTGKGGYYWNSQKKTGELSFFVCDIKTEETAKKIVTRYCNDNNCFAYLMIDTKDHTKAGEGFDDLITDIGVHNIKKVSDFKDLIKNNNPRKASNRSSQGSVSDQDVFFIYGASKNSGDLSVDYNDASLLKTLNQDELESFEDSDTIVYLPITRYAVNQNEGFPEISDLNRMFNEPSLTDFIKEVFGKTKIYAIKSSIAKKMEKEGDRNMITFNDFFKDKLENVFKPKFESVSCFNDMVEFCKTEFVDREWSRNDYWNRWDVLGRFCYTVLNFFGLDYAKYIKNDSLVKVVDSYLVMEFFAETVHNHVYNIDGFKKSDYYDHMNRLFKDIGIDSVDAELVKKTNVAFNQLNSLLKNTLYRDGSDDKWTKLISSDNKTKHSLPKASELRKIIKEQVDNNPIIKYIMATTPNRVGIRNITSKNPITNSADNYNNRLDGWVINMDDSMIELFKVQLSSLIK
jgi:hypothetical protein